MKCIIYYQIKTHINFIKVILTFDLEHNGHILFATDDYGVHVTDNMWVHYDDIMIFHSNLHLSGHVPICFLWLVVLCKISETNI